jgi:preprotein translocase subunit SecG
MVYFLYGVFFLSCIVLVAAVLLQPGKTDAGALFTSNVSSSAFSPRGTATVLSKVTIVAASTFMLSALFLAMPAFNGNISVLSANPDGTDINSSANTNSNTDSNSLGGDTNANTAVPASNANAATPAPVETNTAPAANAPVANKPAANAPAKAPAKK